MAKDGMTLSVEVPEDNTELDMDQENENHKLSLSAQVNEDETQRNKYGLNSPKRKDGHEEENAGAMTPATKLRQTAGINSPKQQEAPLTWGNVDEANNKALASVITQVAPPTNKPSATTGVESLITQVSRENTNGLTPMNIANEKDTTSTNGSQSQSHGICSCLSTLFTCCSSPNTTETLIVDQIGNQQSESQKTGLKQNPTSNANANANTYTSANSNTTANPTSNTNSTANSSPNPNQISQATYHNNSKRDSVLKESPTETEEEVDDEVSQESSTDYGSALLPPLSPENKHKRCLVLDLDETLVHSSFKPVNNPDFIIPVEIDGVVHRVYVLKRPYVDEFLLECSKSYEIVIFTASLSKYADPLLDQLDTHRVVSHRLFRESCTFHGSAYVKDMRRIGRRLKDTIIVDNSPHSYSFQPKNAVPITTWFDDKSDTELKDFLPVLNTTLRTIKDVRSVLDAHTKSFSWLCEQAHVDISKFEP